MHGCDVMLGITTMFCSCGLAIADCDTTAFDRSPPMAIKSEVNNQFAHFEWASDADVVNGYSWLWHYIWNKSSNVGLGVVWEKGQIRQPLTSPLPPGEKACSRKFVSGVRPYPDTDAPIKYGTNRQTQDAAVFVAERSAQQSPSQDAASIFDTAYLDPQGKKVDVHVDIGSQRAVRGYSFQINVSPDLTVAISRLSSVLSSSELASITASAAAQRVDVRSGTLVASVGKEPLGLNELFSPSELADHLKQPYLFFRGARKADFKVETPAAVEKINAEIMVLDKEAARVIFVGEVEMFAPMPR